MTTLVDGLLAVISLYSLVLSKEYTCQVRRVDI